GLVRPEHRPAATWRRSLQACIASLPLQSSLMSKTYLKSDHFSGGGATRFSESHIELGTLQPQRRHGVICGREVPRPIWGKRWTGFYQRHDGCHVSDTYRKWSFQCLCKWKSRL